MDVCDVCRHLGVGELHSRFVDRVATRIAFRGQVVDLSVEFVELSEESPEVRVNGLASRL